MLFYVETWEADWEQWVGFCVCDVEQSELLETMNESGLEYRFQAIRAELKPIFLHMCGEIDLLAEEGDTNGKVGVLTISPRLQREEALRRR